MGEGEPPAGPDIVDVEPGAAAVAWARVAFADIPAYQRSAIARVDAALARAGLGADGVRLTFSRTPRDGALDLAPGRRIAAAPAALGGETEGVTVEVLPAGRAVHLSFRGSYAGLAGAWTALGDWVTRRGLRADGPCWEVYTDPAVPVTDLYIMLRSGEGETARRVDTPPERA